MYVKVNSCHGYVLSGLCLSGLGASTILRGFQECFKEVTINLQVVPKKFNFSLGCFKFILLIIAAIAVTLAVKKLVLHYL